MQNGKDVGCGEWKRGRWKRSKFSVFPFAMSREFMAVKTFRKFQLPSRRKVFIFSWMFLAYWPQLAFTWKVTPFPAICYLHFILILCPNNLRFEASYFILALFFPSLGFPYLLLQKFIIKISPVSETRKFGMFANSLQNLKKSYRLKVTLMKCGQASGSKPTRPSWKIFPGLLIWQ